MKDFSARMAVVTGGGSGMGRELVRQLIAEGCHVATCDVSATALAETKHLCETGSRPQGTRLSTHLADVASEADVVRFRDETADQHRTDKIHLLFNNAGIGGGGSFVSDDRAAWEKTFNVCWGGVYLGCRTFLPMLMKADAGHIVNTSSVNGFWASIGPGIPHTAYCAAKFAVKGFTEALITDLAVTAPHIKCSVVMPGHIGTGIAANSRKIHTGNFTDSLSQDEIAKARFRIGAMLRDRGIDPASLTDTQVQQMLIDRERNFLEQAPMTAAQAATVILDGVKTDRWRILVGRDAEQLDAKVRANPEAAYDAAFYQEFATEAGWRLGGVPAATKK